MGAQNGDTNEAIWRGMHHNGFQAAQPVRGAYAVSVVDPRGPLDLLTEDQGPEDQMKGSCYFSKLDLIKGYHNIELHPDSRLLTATLTPLGLHQC